MSEWFCVFDWILLHCFVRLRGGALIEAPNASLSPVCTQRCSSRSEQTRSSGEIAQLV